MLKRISSNSYSKSLKLIPLITLENFPHLDLLFSNGNASIFRSDRIKICRRLGNRCEIPSISGICRRYPFCGRKFATEPSGRRWIKQPLPKFTNKRHRYRYREYRNHEAWADRRVASSRLLRFARGSRSRRHRLRERWIDASRCPRNGVPGFARRGELAGRTTSP